jgi:hypothetical protein
MHSLLLTPDPENYVLFVDRSGLTMVVSLILIGVQNLHFVSLHQKDAAIATSLAFSLDHSRRGPFNV